MEALKKQVSLLYPRKTELADMLDIYLIKGLPSLQDTLFRIQETGETPKMGYTKTNDLAGRVRSFMLWEVLATSIQEVRE